MVAEIPQIFDCRDFLQIQHLRKKHFLKHLPEKVQQRVYEQLMLGYHLMMNQRLVSSSRKAVVRPSPRGPQRRGTCAH